MSRLKAVTVALLLIILGEGLLLLTPYYQVVEVAVQYVEQLHFDKKRLNPEQLLEVLNNELADPYRNPIFDAELRREIERVGHRLQLTAR